MRIVFIGGPAHGRAMLFGICPPLRWTVLEQSRGFTYELLKLEGSFVFVYVLLSEYEATTRTREFVHRGGRLDNVPSNPS